MDYYELNSKFSSDPAKSIFLTRITDLELCIKVRCIATWAIDPMYAKVWKSPLIRIVTKMKAIFKHIFGVLSVNH